MDSKPIDELNILELQERLALLKEVEPQAPDRVFLKMIEQDRAEILFYIHRIING